MTDSSDETGALLRLERSFAETRDDVISLKTAYGRIQSDLVDLKSSISQLMARYEESRKANWPLLGLVFGQLPIVIAVGTFIMQSFTATSVAPINASIAQISAAQHADESILGQVNTASQQSQQADANSLTDRRQLNDRLHILEQTVTTEQKQTAIDIAKISVSLKEVETQFHKNEAMNNVRFAHDERDKAMIWNAAHPNGPPWATEPFFFPDDGKTP